MNFHICPFFFAMKFITLNILHQVESMLLSCISRFEFQNKLIHSSEHLSSCN